MSFSEVERESGASKSVETLKDTFTKYAGCSWEEAVKEVPQYADENVLKKYKVTKGKAPPEEYKVVLITKRTIYISCIMILCTYIHIYTYLFQIFCERVMAQKKNTPPNVQRVSPHIIVGAEEQLLVVPFENTNTLFYDMVDVSKNLNYLYWQFT